MNHGRLTSVVARTLLSVGIFHARQPEKATPVAGSTPWREVVRPPHGCLSATPMVFARLVGLGGGSGEGGTHRAASIVVSAGNCGRWCGDVVGTA